MRPTENLLASFQRADRRIRGPAHVTVDGETWTFVGDGLLLLAERGAFAAPEAEPERVIAVVGKYLSAPVADPIEVDGSELRAWVGPTPESEPCTYCGGGGEVLHECDCQFCYEQYADCEACAGTGKAIPKRGSGWIGAARINLDQLADLLDAMPDGRLTMWTAPYADRYDVNNLLCRTENVIGLVCGMSHEMAGEGEPVFTPAAQAAG